MNYPKPIYIKETTSTNTSLAEICNNENSIPDLTCVYSSYQSAGRGQRGNTWESEPGANLLFSVVVFPTFIEVKKHFLLSQITALALYDVLSEYTGNISIKWPNDIYWKNKKLCGTLIENDISGMSISRSISGTGVNLNQEKFKSNAPNPVSLKNITGKEYNPEDILNRILSQTATYYNLLKKGEYEEIRKKYFSALFRKEGFHKYKDENGIFYARIIDIETSGRLILEDTSGNIRGYMFKEVSFIIDID